MAERIAAAAGHGGPRPARTEIRLALVMNGGVSLAVWMGGVTHELDLLRRASTGDESGVAEADRPVFHLWRRLTDSANVQVQIDIVSGTSAGGLNGLLLATARGGRARRDPRGDHRRPRHRGVVRDAADDRSGRDLQQLTRAALSGRPGSRRSAAAGPRRSLRR